KLFYSEKIYNSIIQFRSSDTIFVKGGGFIHAHGEKTAPYLIWYFLFYLRLAKRLKKEVVVFPNSFGPFEGLSVKKQVKDVFIRLDLIYAREHVSSESLGKLLNKKIPVEMDLGFFLEKGSQVRAEAILKKYSLNTTDKI